MIILFFVLTSLTLLSFVGMLSNNAKLSYFSCELNKICISGLILYSIIGFINMNEPTAMDVYQGNTTLEITYRDGVPIDSVAVFKNKEKQ